MLNLNRCKEMMTTSTTKRLCVPRRAAALPSEADAAEGRGGPSSQTWLAEVRRGTATLQSCFTAPTERKPMLTL